MSGVIEREYKTLRELGIKFEKSDLEDWLFEAACQILEEINMPRDERNLKGCIYFMLDKTIRNARNLPPNELGYLLLPCKDYRKILLGRIV